MAEVKPLAFTALKRRQIKEQLDPEALTYVETLEQIAREADMLMQSHDETTTRRIQLARVLSVVNFMAQ